MIRNLDLHIPAGERVLLTGPSGAGKSTLLRAMAGVLLTAAAGDLTGQVLIDGVDVDVTPNRPALLLQDPRAGIVAETVGRDVAFGLENLAVACDQIWPRVRASLADSHFPYSLEHPTAALSGGESQRLALAGSLVLASPVLLLDEPTSMLEAAAAADVRHAIRRHADALHSTTVVVEHHLEPWLDFVDRIIVLGHSGELIADGHPDTVLAEKGRLLASQGVWVPGMASPDLVDVGSELVGPWDCGPAELVRAESVSLRLDSRLGRGAGSRDLALADVDATLSRGRTLAVTGPSGAGKSSLVSVLAGLRKPTNGAVRAAAELATARGREPYRWASRDLAARLAWVPQNPELGLVCRNVGEEVLAASRACGRDLERAQRRAAGLLELFGLAGLRSASPYHLSGGEQRRLMVAAALAGGPYAVLLDEPTVGQDRFTWAAVLGAVSGARSGGVGIALATHDTRAVAAVADDVLRLEAGRTAV